MFMLDYELSLSLSLKLICLSLTQTLVQNCGIHTHNIHLFILMSVTVFSRRRSCYTTSPSPRSGLPAFLSASTPAKQT